MKLQIYRTDTVTLYIDNPGTLNKRSLKLAKKKFLMEQLEPLLDELVKHRQHYPQGDTSEVDLKIDFKIEIKYE